jgi:cytoskeletal protein CcmA (bactofilin family)
MGASYTRQSSYADGDVIQASDTNNEFDQLLAAFAASSGHTHDGTAGEGGPVTKLLGTSLTLGDGTSGTDITVTFDGESNDGVLKWMEDEDYFEFSDDILVASTEKLQFRDTAIYIHSSADGQLDLIADTEIQIAATTVDINGNVDISGTLTIGGAGISEAELEILDGATVTTTEINIMDGDTSASATTVVDADRVVFNDAGTMKQVAVTDLAAYFDDEITAMPNLVTTAATTVGALNSGSITSGFGTIDTGSSTITTTGLITGGSLDIDDVVINGTTIGHTDDTDLMTVASGLLTVAGEVSMTTLDIGGTNVTATAAELNYSDTGASVGTVVASKVVTVDANKDVASFRNITLTGELDAGSLDVSGDADIDGTLEADAITIAGVTLAETISDTVGAMVSSNTETGVSVSYDDSDNTLDFVLGTAQTTIESVKNTSLVIGRDDDNLIKFSTDNQIIFEVSGGDNVIFKASGEIEASSLDISGDADIDGTLEADAITVNGTALNTVIAGVTVANATLAATTTVTDSTANTNFPVVFHDESNALLDDTGALRYNPSTGELLVPKLTVAGTTTTVDTVTMNAENAIIFEGATADAHETTLTIVDPTADRTINLPNQSGTVPVLAAASNTAITSTPDELNILDGATVVVGEINALDLGSTAVGTAIASKAVILDSNKDYTGIRNFTITGELDAGSLDISGDADIDGTLEADAITVNGATLNSVIVDEATSLAIALG